MKKISVLFLMLLTFEANAQIFDILKDQVRDKATAFVGKKLVDNVTSEAITTNFNDCNRTDVKDPSFGQNAKFQSLCTKSFNSTAGYLLQPGFYTIELKSFCLKAGTYAPGKGDGYLYAALRGPKKEIINSLVKNWYLHQDIPQQQVQSLIWAVIAKANFKTMSTDLQIVAARLLSKKQILQLSKMGLDFVPDSVLAEAKSNLPSSVQTVLEAENKIRNHFSSSSSSDFGDLERLAMLAGINTQKSEIAFGSWSLHPDGYWVSYRPHGYSHMTVLVYVPDNLVSVQFLPSDHVAVPSNTASQRLMLSDVLSCQ